MDIAREIVLTSLGGERLPKTHLPGRWKARNTTFAALCTQSSMAPITVIAPDPTKMHSTSWRTLAKDLRAKRAAGVGTPFLVFWLPKQQSAEIADDVSVIRQFAQPERVQVAHTQEAFDVFLNALIAKVEVFAERARAVESSDIESPRPSPLDKARTIVASTKDLRGPSGRLSASAVAKLYGVSLSRVGKWLGRSRQALNKVPDASSVQTPLAFFERVARLRSVLDEPDDFRRWLHIGNPELRGKTPLQLLDQGRGQVVADLVDDMLTGSPG